MSGRLFVLHIPKEAILAAVEGVLPQGFETIVFSQWSEDRDTMLVGFSQGEPDEVDERTYEDLN